MSVESRVPDLEPGVVLGHFEIIELIGAGGMGTVFRARDVRLDREVALKVLSEKLFEDDAARRRFLREARLAAAMVHPNIATVHEIDQQNGTLFIAMELVRGHDLKTRLATSGPLSLEEIVSVGRQACEALEAAHTQGVIHRDIKSANIMLTSSGAVKLLDFGLAKPLLEAESKGQILSEDSPTRGRPSPAHERAVLHDEPTAGISRAGVALGTPSYMAPEQAAGKKLDPRADLFSLGVVLYESVTGDLPFRAHSDHEVLEAIRFREARSIKSARPEMPDAFARVIEKCLAKSPNDRFSSAQALRLALDSVAETHLSKPSFSSGARALLQGPGTKRRLAIVFAALTAGIALLYWLSAQPVDGFQPGDQRRIVLADFENRVGDEDFDETLEVVLSAQLDQSSGFVVVPSARVREIVREMGLDEETRSLGFDLAREVSLRAEVPVLVTGSISRLGEEYLLHATLWDVPRSETIRVYEERARGKENVLLALDRLGAAIRRTLGETVPFLRKPQAPAALWTSSSWEALNAYAEALKRDDEDDVTGAIALLRHAVELDPDFAMAYARLGRIYDALGYRPESLDALTKAMASLDRLPPKERGFVQTFYYQATDDHEETLAAAQPMASLFPHDPAVLTSLGHAFMSIGDYPMATDALQRAIELAPDSAELAYNLTNTYLLAGDYDRARVELERLRAVAPGSTWLDYPLGYLSLLEGDAPGAIVYFQRYTDFPDPTRKNRGYYHWIHAHLFAGEYDRAAELLGERIAFSRSRLQPAIEAESLVLLARIDVAFGRNGAAADRIRQALTLPLKNAELQMAGAVAARASALDEARTALSQLREENPGSINNQRLVEELEGEIALSEGKTDEAIRLLRGAASLTSMPSWSEPLARALESSGELEEALAEYMKIVSNKGPVFMMQTWGPPLYAESLGRIAAIHERLGSAAEAERFRDEYSKIRPTIPPEKEASDHAETR